MRHYLLLLLLLVASIASGQSAAQYDKAPEFPGGNPAIETYLTKNLVYPEKARKKNIEGKVLVGFMVNEKGRVVNVSVLKSVHPLLDSQAVRVVRAMPKWKPATKDNKAILAPMAMPINFRLKNPTGPEAPKKK